MQSLLFLLEEAESFRKAGRLNMALKRYLGVKKVRFVHPSPCDSTDMNVT